MLLVRIVVLTLSELPAPRSFSLLTVTTPEFTDPKPAK
jgi:hypothetical protein